MSLRVPRLRLFAGPNGSGKSVLKSYLPDRLLGVYLNPDEVEIQLHSQGFLDLEKMGVKAGAEEVQRFFGTSPFFGDATCPVVSQGKLDFQDLAVNSYHASAVVGFLRKKLLDQQRSFTFESVMSHPSKVEFLSAARESGYRTYLYYVATDDPLINVSRVSNRVALGGHSVPAEKIVSRYHRSLDLLMQAIKVCDRAFIFDNSTDNTQGTHTWLAEITAGKILELKADIVPSWFQKAVLDKIAG